MCNATYAGLATSVVGGVLVATGYGAPVGLALMAAGGGIAAAGASYEQGKAAQAQQEYQAKVQENNATMADYAAQDAARRGELEQQQLNRVVAEKRAAGQSAYAASGLSLGTGASAAFERSLDVAAAEDAATIKDNTNLDVWGLRYQGQSLRADAGASRVAGENAMRAGKIGAATSLLQGATQAAGLYYAGGRGTQAPQSQPTTQYGPLRNWQQSSSFQPAMTWR